MRAPIDDTTADTALERAVFMAHSEAIKLDRDFDLFRLNDLHNLLTSDGDSPEWGRRLDTFKAAAERFDAKWGVRAN